MSTRDQRKQERDDERRRRSYARFRGRTARTHRPEDRVSAACDFIQSWMTRANAADKRTAAERFVKLANDLARGR